MKNNYILTLLLQLVHKLKLGMIGLFICFLINLQAISQEIQSAFSDRNIISSIADTSKVLQLIKTADSIRFLSFKQNISLLTEAINISRELNYIEGLAEAKMKLALSYCTVGDYDKALLELQAAYPYCFMNHGERFLKLRSLWYSNMSVPYTYYGLNDSAIQFVLKGLQLAFQLKDTNLIIHSHINLGAIWINNKKFDNAERYLKKAEYYVLESKDSTYLPLIYSNFAATYANLNDTIKQFHYATKALNLCNKSTDIKTKVISLRLLGNYYLKTKDYHKALEHLFEALKYSDKDNSYLLYLNLRLIAETYYYLENIPKAYHYAHQSLLYAEKTSLQDRSLAYLYKLLSDIYSSRNEYKKSLDYYQQYAQLSLRLSDIARNSVMDELEVKSQILEKNTELSNKQIQLVQHKRRIENRNMWLVIVSVTGVFTIVLLLIFIGGTKRRIFIMKQRGQINELKAMMNGEENERKRLAKELHDGVGGLLSAASMHLNTLADNHKSINDDPVFGKTERLIDEISVEVRKAAHNLMPDVLLYHNLPEAIRIFCSNIQRGKNMEIKVLSSGDYNKLNQDLLLSCYRIVQELIQNIIKHASATEVLVQLQKSNKILSITVEDNGIGYDPNIQYGGIGLNNISDRVKSHGGKLLIDSSQGNGASFYIEFGLNK